MARDLAAARAAALRGKPLSLGFFGAAIRPFLESGPAQLAAFTSGGATVNPNFFNTAQGQAELRQRQQIEAETQLRNIRAELTRQSQIVQSGADMSPSFDLEGLQEDLSALAPFVNAGVLGANDVRTVVKTAAIGTLAGQRDRREAAKISRAIATGVTNGTFDESQLASAVQSLESNFDFQTLSSVPEYMALVGKGGELEQAREEAQQEFADTRGVERRFVGWNERENRPVYDEDEMAFERFRIVSEAQERESLRQPIVDKIKSLDGQINTVVKAIQNAEAQQKDPSTLFRQHERLVGEKFNTLKQLDQLSPVPPIVAPAATGDGAADAQPAVSQAASVRQATTLPAFDTRGEAIAAAQQAGMQPGARILIGGVRYKLGPDRLFRRE